MRLYLNAGFGGLLGVDLLVTLRQRGFAGIRQNITGPESAPAICSEIAEAGLQPILLLTTESVNGGAAVPAESLPELARYVATIADSAGLFAGEHPAAIEIGNEPDRTFDGQPQLFARTIRAARDGIRQVSQTAQIIVGGVTSTSRTRLDYLAAAAADGLPADCIVGYHTYRGGAPEMPADGFGSRDEEFDELRAIAAGRPLWCTEIGWHTVPFEEKYGPWGLFSRHFDHSDDEVADYAEREIRINARQGAVGLVWYQLNDGPSPDDAMDHHGIRRIDGTWKKVADRLASLGPEVNLAVT